MRNLYFAPVLRNAKNAKLKNIDFFPRRITQFFGLSPKIYSSEDEIR